MLVRQVRVIVGGSLFFVLSSCGGRASHNSPGDGDGGGADNLGGETGDHSGGSSGSDSGGTGGLLLGTGGVNGGVSGGATGGASMGPKHCLSGTFDPDPDNPLVPCKAWSSCAPGTYRTAFGSRYKDTKCEPCASGTFRDQPDVVWCEPWQLCRWNEVSDFAGSAVKDRTCKDAAVFPPFHLLDRALPGPFLVTEEGAYFVLHQAYDAVELVVRYSLAGEMLAAWEIPNLVVSSQDYSATADMVGLGSDICLAGQRWATDPESRVVSEPSFVSNYSSGGVKKWERALSSDEDDHFVGVQATSHGDKIYALGLKETIHCEMDLDSVTNCTPEWRQGERQLALSIFDAVGDVTETMVLEEGSDINQLHDVVVNAEGHVFALVTRIGANYNYEWGMTVVEFDTNGDQVTEHVFPAEFDAMLPQLAVSGAGPVYALLKRRYERVASLPVGSTLYGLADGEIVLEQSLPLELGSEVNSFTATSSGLLLLGWAQMDDISWPFLAKTDTSGIVSSEEMWTMPEARLPYEQVAVKEAPDGRVFVAGLYGTPYREASGSVVVTEWKK
jgi:hypothetical protein